MRIYLATSPSTHFRLALYSSRQSVNCFVSGDIPYPLKLRRKRRWKEEGDGEALRRHTSKVTWTMYVRAISSRVLYLIVTRNMMISVSFVFPTWYLTHQSMSVTIVPNNNLARIFFQHMFDNRYKIFVYSMMLWTKRKQTSGKIIMKIIFSRPLCDSCLIT